MQEQNQDNNSDDSSQKQSFLKVLQNVVSAIFGIQSDKNRQDAFKKGDASQYITMGIVAVVLIMCTMIFIVNSVLESAGK